MSKVTSRTRSAVCQLLAVRTPHTWTWYCRTHFHRSQRLWWMATPSLLLMARARYAVGCVCVRVTVLGSRVLPSLLPCVSTISWARAWLGRR